MSYTYETIAAHVGEELGVTEWMIVDQTRIQQFADATDDHQWIHVDAERARQGPFGTTIAHGFLTLALTAKFAYELDLIPQEILGAINYGLDRVRFLSPVPSGARIRARARLMSAEPRGEGRLLLKIEYTVEIEGQERPAMVAETLSLLIR